MTLRSWRPDVVLLGQAAADVVTQADIACLFEPVIFVASGQRWGSVVFSPVRIVPHADQKTSCPHEIDAPRTVMALLFS